MRIVGRIFGLSFAVATVFLAVHYLSWQRSVESERAMGQDLNTEECESRMQSYANRLQQDRRIHGFDRALFLNKEYSRDCLNNPIHVEFSDGSFSVTSAGLDRIEGTRDDFSASPEMIRP